MAARRRCTVVRQPSQVMVGLGESGYGVMVLRQNYQGYLGFGWMHRRGSSTCAAVRRREHGIIFYFGETTVRHKVTTEASLHP